MNWEESSSDFDNSGEHASDRRTVLTERVSEGLVERVSSGLVERVSEGLVERVSEGLVEKASAALMGREGVWGLGFTAGSAGEREISFVLIA